MRLALELPNSIQRLVVLSLVERRSEGASA